ncbi:MAG TPA: hypothetical protein VJK29_20880 [Terriglobales bacterium]|nr:hypothetical protein [Terriglobales bacterium]
MVARTASISAHPHVRVALLLQEADANGFRIKLHRCASIAGASMAERIVLSKSFAPQRHSEDWWFLVIEDGGEMHVEHKRVRHNPFKHLRKDIRNLTVLTTGEMSASGTDAKYHDVSYDGRYWG